MKVASAKEKKSVSAIIEELFSQREHRPLRQSAPHGSLLPNNKPSAKELQKAIADSVAQHLLTSSEWIADAISNIELYRYGESIFGDRIHHFEEEKKFLAEKFTPWLIKRILWHVGNGKNVRLVIDSGTTLNALFPLVARALRREAERFPNLNNLVILTNNVAGAECYMHFSRIPENALTPFGSETVQTLSDYIRCKLLPGTIQTRYVALIGKDTNEALLAEKAQADEAVFIGLIAGNWIRIDKERRYPIPLAREDGQVGFKETMVRVCDELYLPSPLGKLFVYHSLGEINDGLLKRGSPRYREVSIEEDKIRKINLVSTCRPNKRNILFTHSECVRTAYGISCLDEDGLPNSNTAIQDMLATVFRFDKWADLERKHQIQIEFPHDYTQEELFMGTFFSV